MQKYGKAFQSPILTHKHNHMQIFTFQALLLLIYIIKSHNFYEQKPKPDAQKMLTMQYYECQLQMHENSRRWTDIEKYQIGNHNILPCKSVIKENENMIILYPNSS